jgi:uncharacterized protein
MKCPACGSQLSRMSVGTVSVDVCGESCGGVWFDHSELRKVDEKWEAEGAALEHLPTKPGVVIDSSKRRECPRCDGVVMSQHFYSPKHLVTVDECPSCGGYWLDPGELEQIRAGVATQEEWHRATEAILQGAAATEPSPSPRSAEEPQPWWRIFTFLRPRAGLEPGSER